MRRQSGHIFSCCGRAQVPRDAQSRHCDLEAQRTHEDHSCQCEIRNYCCYKLRDPHLYRHTRLSRRERPSSPYESWFRHAIANAPANIAYARSRSIVADRSTRWSRLFSILTGLSLMLRTYREESCGPVDVPSWGSLSKTPVAFRGNRPLTCACGRSHPKSFGAKHWIQRAGGRPMSASEKRFARLSITMHHMGTAGDGGRHDQRVMH